MFSGTCQGCHQVIARADEGNNYKAKQVPITRVGTDPVTATNADRNCAKTLILEGTKKDILAGEKFGPESAAISIPVNGAVGVILNHPIKSLEAGLRPMRTKMSDFGDTAPKSVSNDDSSEVVSAKSVSVETHVKKHLQELAKSRSTSSGAGTCSDPDSVLVYKARPLNGIWATAPFLHNGSVPSLWAMLQKPENRPTSFWVGSRQFDPINVGYDVSQGLNEFKVLNQDGEIQAGNSNRGHEYGTDWTDEEKWSVIEYMKTL